MLPTIHIDLTDQQTMITVARALSSPARLDILNALNERNMSVKELSELLNLPISSAAMHIALLEEAHLVETKLLYSKLGKSKLCSRSCDGVLYNLWTPTSVKNNQLVLPVPIGSYTDYSVRPECGMVTAAHSIGQDNDVDNFFSPDRFQASLLWFSSGYVEYRISRKKLPKHLRTLEFSFEACSEAPFYRNDWKSDITMWVNGMEIGTWTCPGDFGGRRGKNNPDWWSLNFTQYGILTNWKITEDGTYLDNIKISDATLASVELDDHPYISFRIGVKNDARYRGGINLFGKDFGDYTQDILVTASW